MTDNPYQTPESLSHSDEPTGVAKVLRESPRAADFFASARWIKQAIDIVFRHFWLWVGGVLLITIASQAAGAVVPVLGTIANAILGPMLYAGVSYTADRAMRNQKIELADFFSGFQIRAGALAGLGGVSILGWFVIMLIAIIALIMMLVMLAGFDMASVGGLDWFENVFASSLGLQIVLITILLIVLFALPLIAMLFYAPTLLILHPEVSFGRSLSLSFVGVFKNFFSFIPYSVLIMLLVIAGLLVFFVGIFVAMPIISVSIYTSYRDIFVESEMPV